MENLYVLPILLFSIVIHEISHGWMALKLGDPTARDLGRLTLNPIPHIDPVGSILVPLMSYIAAGTVFIAWAKPVPVNPMHFSNYRRDDILVSVVGPVSNLLIALACSILYVLFTKFTGDVEGENIGVLQYSSMFFTQMFSYGIAMNIYLAVFNLIPVPPLDGSHVVSSLLPPQLGERYRQIGFAGILIIILLMRLQPVRDAVVSTVQFILVPYVLLINMLS
ncbi:MAG: site-2 protease family protein [Ignavibacteriales bacterium]|nr:site-2 protease family protein [Ignavibacteriales bacterium]MBI3005677.1 site-2 protease family protein [Ignavibacteriales bacterium]